MPETERLALRARLLDDDTIDLAYWAAACLVLLYAPPSNRIILLRLTNIHPGTDGLMVNLGVPVPIPPHLDELITEPADHLRHERPHFGDTMPRLCDPDCVQSVQVDGLGISFERVGQGPPVVLVHGYVGDGPSTWRPQLDALADDFDVIAIDLPGAGGSDDPPESFGMRGFADALAGFITALGLTGPHLVGLSFGGAALIEFSRRHQSLASTLTLVGAYAGWAGSLPPDEVQYRLDQALELSRLAPNELVDTLFPTMFAPEAPAEVTQGFAESLQRFHPRGLRAMARAVTKDLTDALESIRLPTLLFYGEQDTRAPAGVAVKIHNAIPGSELIQLPDAGHVCNVDASECFNAHLRRFIHGHASR